MLKKVLYFTLLILCLGMSACTKANTINVILPDGFTVKAELALTEAEREKGLMNRETLPENGGMLFVFNEEAPRYFWMKNTIINLDMLFIGEDQVVNRACVNVPRSYAHTPDHQVAVRGGMAKYVLELPAKSSRKHNVTAGSKIIFEDDKIDYSLVGK